jgi:uncharacterized repeat protein (TIGR03803 family)
MREAFSATTRFGAKVSWVLQSILEGSMNFLETKSEGKCGLNKSAVGPKFVSPQLVSAKPAGVRLALALLFTLLLATAPPAHGQTESVRYSFANSPDGANPRFVTPVLDTTGNLYGTTNYGGAYGLGTVFELTPSGTETVLHSFDVNGMDGAYPEAGPVLYRGNLYGTTVEGGTYNIDGTVFELKHTTKGWKEKILHSFGAAGDGSQPYCVLTVDTATGNLYGTTNAGGTYSYGTVFKLTPSGTETVLWSFGNGTDGAHPVAGVVRDTAGNLYGTTEYGGDYGYGTVFELTPSGTERVLWSFGNGTDGAHPLARLVIYKGNLYGTTVDGGIYGDGTVFEVTLSGTEKIRHTFDNNDIDGFHPHAGLTIYQGNFYGTTASGGGIASAAGTVFEMTPSGTTYSILHTFGGDPDGAFPYGGVAFDKSGNLYGTTSSGGTNGFGTVYKMTP